MAYQRSGVSIAKQRREAFRAAWRSGMAGGGDDIVAVLTAAASTAHSASGAPSREYALIARWRSMTKIMKGGSSNKNNEKRMKAWHQRKQRKRKQQHQWLSA